MNIVHKNAILRIQLVVDNGRLLFQDGDTPLHLAVSGKHLNIVKTLLRRTEIGLNKDNRVINVVSKEPSNFVDSALKKNQNQTQC